MVWVDYDAVERSEDSVVLAATVQPQAGWPFRLDLRIAFALDGDGLHTTVTALNTGPTRAPFGTAPHPYLVRGRRRRARRRLRPCRSRPRRCRRSPPTACSPPASRMSRAPTSTSASPVRIGTTFVDHAYTGLAPDADGLHRVRLTADAGRGRAALGPPGAPWVQVHTADPPEPDNDRTGLAVEPMTCAPDAFNSGQDLVVLPPGGSHTASWSVRAL